MVPLLALAPDLLLRERVVVVAVGFALALALARARGRMPTGLFHLCAGLGIAMVVGVFVPADGRGILALVSGAVGGAVACMQSVRVVPASISRSWWLMGACVIVAPLLALAMPLCLALLETNEPLERMPNVFPFVAVGVVAGVLPAAIVGFISVMAPERE